MNLTHLHLLLNHVSIMAALFSIAIYLYGMLKKNSSLTNLALMGFVFAALAAIPVYLTGEDAEESVEHLAGLVKANIHEHEEAAEISIWLIGISGAIALAALIFKNVKFFSTSAFALVMTLMSIVSGVSISYTGYLGGFIRHSEISTNAVQQNSQGEQGGEEDAD